MFAPIRVVSMIFVEPYARVRRFMWMSLSGTLNLSADVLVRKMLTTFRDL